MLPEVSVIVPCYNEAATIEGLLDALREQTFPADRMEVLIVDGMSDDGTREQVRAYARKHREPEVRLVDNPDRIIPAALNRGIEAGKGDVIVRLDAHSKPEPDYIGRSMAVLERTQAANVGGLWQIEPGEAGWQARSIAAAAAHALGAGDARYRISGEAGPVDTVPFGAFRREWLERVGPFNESLLSNEDYEYNVRLRQAGGKVWFDPEIRSTYYARPTFTELARQYARYGYWKARMLLDHPGTLRWRQALPPLFVLIGFALLVAGFFWPPGWGLAAAQAALYLIVLQIFAERRAVGSGEPALHIGLPIAWATMHLSWGGAFWWGLLTGLIGRFTAESAENAEKG